MSLGSCFTRIGLVSALVLFFPAHAQSDRSNAVTPALLIDERAIRRVVDDIDTAVDQKDWQRARRHFASQVKVDFTSLAGGQPATVSGDQLIDGWRTNLYAEKQSFHLRGNHLIDVQGDKATVSSVGYAWNALPRVVAGGAPEIWEVWGTYRHGLTRTRAGWKVEEMSFNAVRQRGDARAMSLPREKFLSTQ